jgi:hypothetical protein
VLLRRVALLPDEDAIALALHLPDGKRRERRRPRRLSGPQVEAGVVPRAADAVADDKAFRERPMVMTAMRVDGKNLRTSAHQQDRLIADMPEQGLAGKFTQRYAAREIRPAGRGLRFSHVHFLTLSLGADVEATLVASHRKPFRRFLSRKVPEFPEQAEMAWDEPAVTPSQ